MVREAGSVIMIMQKVNSDHNIKCGGGIFPPFFIVRGKYE